MNQKPEESNYADRVTYLDALEKWELEREHILEAAADKSTVWSEDEY